MFYQQMILLNNIKTKNAHIFPLVKLLTKIYKKKVIFNIIRLKYYFLNSDILTQMIVYKLKNRKYSPGRILNKVSVYTPKFNPKLIIRQATKFKGAQNHIIRDEVFRFLVSSPQPLAVARWAGVSQPARSGCVVRGQRSRAYTWVQSHGNPPRNLKILSSCVSCSRLKSMGGAQVAYDPRALAVYSEVGGACHVRVHDAGEFCAPGEAVPFWTLQMRAQAAQQARPVNYYIIQCQAGCAAPFQACLTCMIILNNNTCLFCKF